jgi:hypothetical protein
MMTSLAMEQEVGAFARQVAAALAPLRKVGSDRWKAGQLRVGHGLVTEFMLVSAAVLARGMMDEHTSSAIALLQCNKYNVLIPPCQHSLLWLYLLKLVAEIHFSFSHWHDVTHPGTGRSVIGTLPHANATQVYRLGKASQVSDFWKAWLHGARISYCRCEFLF